MAGLQKKRIRRYVFVLLLFLNTVFSDRLDLQYFQNTEEIRHCHGVSYTNT